MPPWARSKSSTPCKTFLHPSRVRESRLTLNLIRNTMDDLGFHEEDIEDLIEALKEKA
jgi:hypothetical protein